MALLSRWFQALYYSRVLQKNQLNQYVLAKKVKIKNKIQKSVDKASS